MNGSARAATAAAASVIAVLAGAEVAGTAHASALSDAQRGRADALVSVFENGTPDIQWCYVEALGDGRGFTAGRAGFTSATADLLAVAERYTRAVGDNPLAPFVPRLRELAPGEDGSTDGLEGLPAAWRETCEDPRQRAAQTTVADDLYFRPAVRRWRRAGLRLPLSLALFYDTLIQHGEGEDPDGMPALVRRAGRRAGGTPARAGVTERAFLRAFLTERRRTLERAADPDTRAVWAESVGRVDVFRQLLTSRQLRLAAPVRLRTREYRLDLR